MITYVNSENTVKYRALFDRANEALGLTDTTPITTLEEYFAHIKELAALDRADIANEQPKYTILPVDEEIFVIDANTRTITVPPGFKKHGISVQGDEIAEIIYFEIDRYFDATDLDTKQIYIQWENAPDVKGNTEKNISVPWIKDIVSKPGKIIFGWPISSEITSRAGRIQFSVRFVSFTNDNPPQLTYSFSTLTASANINPALDLDVEGVDAFEIIDHNDLIFNRFVNSNVVGNQPAQKPQLFEDLVAKINLTEKDDVLGIHYTTLAIQADSTDAGLLSIDWKYIDARGKDGSMAADGSPAYPNVIDYRLSDDRTFVSGKSYYKIKEDTQPVVYEPAVDFEYGDAIPEPNQIYYEKFYTCRADKVGTYYAIITNKVGHASDTIETTRCTVPAAETPIIVTNILGSFILDSGADMDKLLCEASSKDGGELSYQWSKDGEPIEGANANNYQPAAEQEGIYSVVVTNKINNSEASIKSADCRVTYSAKPVRLSSPSEPVSMELVNGQATLSFSIMKDVVATDSYDIEWYKYKKDGDEDSVPPGPTDDLLYSIVGTTESDFNYTVNSHGRYYAKIINNRNGTKSEPVYTPLFTAMLV